MCYLQGKDIKKGHKVECDRRNERQFYVCLHIPNYDELDFSLCTFAAHPSRLGERAPPQGGADGCAQAS